LEGQAGFFKGIGVDFLADVVGGAESDHPEVDFLIKARSWSAIMGCTPTLTGERSTRRACSSGTAGGF